MSHEIRTPLNGIMGMLQLLDPGRGTRSSAGPVPWPCRPPAG
jgi:signal transduction histidine kinase